MEPAAVAALFAQTLLGEYHGDEAWNAVQALRRAGDRNIFEHAAAWCLSDDPLKRARAADVLCQLRRANGTEDPDWMFRDEAYSLLTKMLEDEMDQLVLNSVIHALGHLGIAGAVPLILRYRDHPSEDIRFAATFALGCFPNHPQSVDGLLKLSSDAEADVRDWAVFGLGVLGDADSPEIREALLRCLDDTSANVREEAAVGLGKRRDPRVVPHLWTMLNQPEPGDRAAEATAALLGLDQYPEAWNAAEFRRALAARFPSLG